MSTEQLNSIDDLERFVDGSQKAAFAVLGNKQEKYLWVQSILIKHNYLALQKPARGVVRQYIRKITGYSRQQLDRLIKQYKKTGRISYAHKKTNGFELKYTKADTLALVAIDELHGTLNGITTKKLCERAFNVYKDQRYERLATISVSHLYNLRGSTTYTRQRTLLDKTKPAKSNIGVRRKPDPNGAPGYLRIDTVHQGDYDGEKGVYHINAVDEVTQFEIVCTVEKISEHYLQPILQYILDAFPFKIVGFHSDNGSEYINKTVVKLLNKLFIEFTKSRPRTSGDNGLVESKNGSIVRKTFGYMHIPQKFAGIINVFNTTYLNYYLNYHRPCLFASMTTDLKGKEVKKYKYENVFTPYEKFKSLPGAEQYLKDKITFAELDHKANVMSDEEAAREMNIALRKLFGVIFKSKVSSPKLRATEQRLAENATLPPPSAASSLSKETQRLLGVTDRRYKPQLFERPGKAKSQTSLRAAQIELQGGQIETAVERGVEFNHIEKVQNAQQGLAEHIARINTRLSYPELQMAERRALEAELSKASKLLDHTEKFVPRTNPTQPPLRPK